MAISLGESAVTAVAFGGQEIQAVSVGAVDVWSARPSYTRRGGDNFNRADGVVGGQWKTFADQTWGGVQVRGNAVQWLKSGIGTPDLYQPAIHTAATATTDAMFARAKLVAAPTNYPTGVIIRSNPSLNTGVIALISAGKVQVAQTTGPTSSSVTLVGATVNRNLAAGDTITLLANGTRYALYVNDEPKPIWVWDGPPLAGNRHAGLYVQGDSSAYSAPLDDFEFGDVTGVVPPAVAKP
ncbi:hypothetical protein [Nocardia sp. NPDC052566]|uniref:hypothetical protein n=1 Tax=Nocardia sp. NPDC052566 TaxID=3364330 RepID=UPI0037C8F8F4